MVTLHVKIDFDVKETAPPDDYGDVYPLRRETDLSGYLFTHPSLVWSDQLLGQAAVRRLPAGGRS